MNREWEEETARTEGRSGCERDSGIAFGLNPSNDGGSRAILALAPPLQRITLDRSQESSLAVKDSHALWKT